MSPPRKMPEWAYNQMIEGLQKMLVLRLQGAPPADSAAALAAVWEEALTPHTWAFVQPVDADRLPEAFRRLIRQADRWQQPAQLIRLIPPRPEQPVAGLLEQKREPLSEAERACAKARLQQIFNRLAQAKSYQPTYPKEKP